MLDILESYSIEQVIIFTVMLALAVKATSDFFDWCKKKYQEKFDKDYKQKSQEIASHEQYETCQKRFEESMVRYHQVEQKIDLLTETVNSRLDKIDKSITRLTDSDMHDIKGWIVEKHHKFMNQGWIDDFSKDILEKRYADYLAEGGNSYIGNLMAELRRLPNVPPKGED